MGKKKDLTGQRFGRLVVVEEDVGYLTSGGKHRCAWKCKCDCGNTTSVVTYQLTSGKTRSCGCLILDLAHERKSFNEYELFDDYCAGYDRKGRAFIFDIDDYDSVSQHRWFVDDRGYVFTPRPGGGNHIALHRYVMGVENTGFPLVDHINGNRSDCRKCNLRFATQSMNQMNIKNWASNKSGIRGVNWDSRLKKWKAAICKDQKINYLGWFTNIEDAIQARKEAEERLYGEYSYDASQEIAFQQEVLSPC